MCMTTASLHPVLRDCIIAMVKQEQAEPMSKEDTRHRRLEALYMRMDHLALERMKRDIDELVDMQKHLSNRGV